MRRKIDVLYVEIFISNTKNKFRYITNFFEVNKESKMSNTVFKDQL